MAHVVDLTGDDDGDAPASSVPRTRGGRGLRRPGEVRSGLPSKAGTKMSVRPSEPTDVSSGAPRLKRPQEPTLQNLQDRKRKHNYRVAQEKARQDLQSGVGNRGLTHGDTVDLTGGSSSKAAATAPTAVVIIDSSDEEKASPTPLQRSASDKRKRSEQLVHSAGLPIKAPVRESNAIIRKPDRSPVVGNSVRFGRGATHPMPLLITPPSGARKHVSSTPAISDGANLVSHGSGGGKMDATAPAPSDETKLEEMDVSQDFAQSDLPLPMNGTNSQAGLASGCRHSAANSALRIPRVSPTPEGTISRNTARNGVPEDTQKSTVLPESHTNEHGAGSRRSEKAQSVIAAATPAQPGNDLSRHPADVVELHGSSAQAAPENSKLPFISQPIENKVEHVIGRHLQEMRSDNEHNTRALLQQARTSRVPQLAPEVGLSAKPATPFSFSSLSTTMRKSGVKKTGVRFDIDLNGRITPMAAALTTFRTEDDMPAYYHYVPIKHSFLAPNVLTVHCNPYFSDDFALEKVDWAQHFPQGIDMPYRNHKLDRLLRSQNHSKYLDHALAELQITWADVIRYLLDDLPDAGMIAKRDELLEEDFAREHHRNAIVLSSLPPSSIDKLTKAAATCERFERMANFPLWQIARKHIFDWVREDGNSVSDEDDTNGSTGEDKDALDGAVTGMASCRISKGVRDPAPTQEEMTCLVCFRFDCNLHGEIKEREDDDDDSDGSNYCPIVTDIINPPTVNHRTRMAFPPQPQLLKEMDAGVSNASKKNKKILSYWATGRYGNASKPDNRAPFYPCHHPGQSCEVAACTCYDSRIPCEKTCSCPATCPSKFDGCACAGAGKGSHCYENERCVCFNLGRECDADLCTGCGVCDVLDPLHRDKDNVMNGRCHNASIQRGVSKLTLLGNSEIHGNGLYAAEIIRHHDFVGEYVGEILTQEEAERRGAIYEHQKLSYLFSLNQTQEIDSTYYGNEMRFINHASRGANLYPRIILCNTVHRIALYAQRYISKGEELFFDYGPKFPGDQLEGKAASAKSAPHVRNAKLVVDFHEVEQAKDEDGNMRARKTTKGKGLANDTFRMSKHRTGRRPSDSSSKGAEPDIDVGADDEDDDMFDPGDSHSGSGSGGDDSVMMDDEDGEGRRRLHGRGRRTR